MSELEYGEGTHSVSRLALEALELAPDATAILDRRGRILFLSRVFRKTFDLTEGDNKYSLCDLADTCPRYPGGPTGVGLGSVPGAPEQGGSAET